MEDFLISQKPSTTRINEQIRVPQVRLIDAAGEQMGIVSIDSALKHAVQAGLDLVEISPNVEPPVCRIMDYGKYLFEQNKRKAAQKKKQKVIGTIKTTERKIFNHISNPRLYKKEFGGGLDFDKKGKLENINMMPGT